MKAIFANAGHEMWLDVAEQLISRHGWSIPYLIGSEVVKQKARKLFPEAIFHTNNEAKNNVIPQGCEKVPLAPLDADILSGVSKYQHLLLKMCDRMNWDGTYSLQKRVFYYHWQISYWLGVLNWVCPDVVVFRTAPHQPYFFALYAVARYLKIKTIMFERTSIPGVVLPVSSYEDGSETLQRHYRQDCAAGAPVKLSEESEAYLAKMQGSYSEAMPSHLKYRLARHQGGGLPSNWRLVLEALRGILTVYRQRQNVRQSLRKHLYKTFSATRKKRLQNYYASKAQRIDMSRPFIFAALQCEPERQTVPAGGWFADQYLMVEMLSRLVPTGWQIYVKEHVSQYKIYQHGELSRTRAFYDRINDLPNVTLVPLEVKSFDLIDKAIASATVSGSVGWESVVRGRPALLFGHAWYQGCEGVFPCANRKDAEYSLTQIASGYRLDADKVARFVSSTEQTGLRGYIDNLHMEMNVKTRQNYEENVAAFVECIHHFYGNDGIIEDGRRRISCATI